MKYFNPNSYATDPLGLKLSINKVIMLNPYIKKYDYLQEKIEFGDSNPAVVIETKPLIVAAYSGDFDAVVLLVFPKELVKKYKLKKKSRLVTVNTFDSKFPLAVDVFKGPNPSTNWANISPEIVDFISDDKNKIEKRKETVSEEWWEKVYELGLEHLNTRLHLLRDGRPLLSDWPFDLHDIYPAVNLDLIRRFFNKKAREILFEMTKSKVHHKFHSKGHEIVEFFSDNKLALEFYRRGVQYNEKDKECWEHITMLAYNDFKYLDEAEEAIRKVLELDPENHIFLYNLGLVRFDKKDYRKAEELFTEFLNVTENGDEWYQKYRKTAINKLGKIRQP